MASTASVLKTQQGVQLFFVLKITGLAPYFCCVINPTSSIYGAGAWSLPAGRFVVQGMMEPDGDLTQNLEDIVGCIASAETLSIKVVDFQATDAVAGGQYPYFSRLDAPGRLGLLGPIPELESNIRATDGPGATFSVRGAAAGSTVGGTNAILHIGGEAIQVTAGVVADSTGRATLTVGARNVYPCDADYPPVPYHDVVLRDVQGVPGVNQYVTSEPFNLLGRSAAFYIGHMQPNGWPCTESEMLRRVVGRITKVSDVGDGTFQIGITSVMSMLKGSGTDSRFPNPIAPGLAQSNIVPGQIYITPNWQGMGFWVDQSRAEVKQFGGSYTSGILRITQGIYYSVDDLLIEIQHQLDTFALRRTLDPNDIARDGGWHFQLGIMEKDGRQHVTLSPNTYLADDIGIGVSGDLLRVLGFTQDSYSVTSQLEEWDGLASYEIGDRVHYTFDISRATPWDVAHAYVIGDVVSINYLATGSTSTDPRTGAGWTRTTAPSARTGNRSSWTYVSGHGWIAGQVVEADWYVAIQAGTGNDPLTSPTFWARMEHFWFEAIVANSGRHPPDPTYWKPAPNVPLIIAEDPCPSVFVPLDSPDTSLFTIDDPNAKFFTDQGDQSGSAYIRFGDGQIARLISQGTGPTASLLTILGPPLTPALHFDRRPGPGRAYYRTSQGEPATVQQVLLLEAPSPGTAGIGLMLGRLLSSTGQQSDAEFDAYPQGAGLGLGNLVDKTSFSRFTYADVARGLFIDNTYSFEDIARAIVKEYGLFITWDATNGRVKMSQMIAPQVAVTVSPAIGLSTQSEDDEIPPAVSDPTSVRATWELDWSWDPKEKKFLQVFTWNDNVVRSQYGTIAKSEKIEDKTLLAIPGGSITGAAGAAVQAQIGVRSYFYRQQWARVTISMNKIGLAISPAEIHQIVHAVLRNPFTGLRGITATDAIYAMLAKVTMKASGKGRGSVDLFLNRYDTGTAFRPLSPSALVDFGAAGHGYNGGTGVLTVLSHFVSDGIGFDGIDFSVGDKAILMSRETTDYVEPVTVAAIAGDGHTLTIDAGLPSPPTDQELVLILDDYATATAARKAGVSWQGDEDGKIASLANDNKWS